MPCVPTGREGKCDCRRLCRWFDKRGKGVFEIIIIIGEWGWHLFYSRNCRSDTLPFSIVPFFLK